ncbi:MAG TPA: hypothetical protein VM287_13570 [Egibacteraceae bacterium]|nr:hypothetical protein [Egibacteraceae bacterium]
MDGGHRRELVLVIGRATSNAAMNEDFVDDDVPVVDAREEAAIAALERFFDERRESVFFSRQLEVIHESDWFHWITNRALRDLIAADVIRSEVRELRTGGTVNLMWHRSYRYFRREAARVVALIEEYADPNIGAALVLEGFARRQFVMHGRNTNNFGGRTWTASAHDMDFIFERDGIAYGVEVKNTLGYMDHGELLLKIDLCRHLGIRPVFAARMLPKSWVKAVVDAGGFALIMKYQLYPWAHRDLARRVQADLGLPVDSPRALQDGTMQRFVTWHERNL